MNKTDLVYKIVKNIPKGKVETYGEVAGIVNNELRIMGKGEKISPRYVGYLLHNNPDPKTIPCHRVVDRNGKLAENYRFGGWKEQKKKLLEEGVGFRDERYVNRKFLY